MEMSGLNRRVWSTKEKTAIVTEMIKGGDPMTSIEICRNEYY